MKRSRSCAMLLAAAVGAVYPLSLAGQGAPATQPAANASQPISLPAGATTQPASTQAATQPSSTEPASTQASATQPSTSLASATQPATTQVATTAPADHPPGTIRLNFRDTPLDVILERISQDAGFAVVKEAPIDVRVTVMSLQPVTPTQAVALLNAVLDGNGLTALQDDHTLRIVAREKAKKGNLPVHFGNDPLLVEATNELITQVIPAHNVDAVKLRQDLTPLIGPDADVTANSGANAIVMTDTSANIKRIVQIVSILDKREGTTSEVKIIALKNANAAQAAKLILSIFRPDEAPLTKAAAAAAAAAGQLPNHHDGPLLGTGVDQALHGGKVTAAADERTNSVIVAAPSDTLKAIEKMLKEIDENPATASMPTIKTFHLKVADAQQLARSLRFTFLQSEEGQPVQSHQIASDEAFHSRVVITYEEHSNTVIVTAPVAAMAIIEGLISDIDGHSPGESTVRSFPLKYADAAATTKALLSIFMDNSTGLSRLQTGARDKVSVTADVRTNTVFVTAPTESITLVEKTVHDLDANPTSGTTVKFYRLKQADSDATAKLIINFFKTPESGVIEKRPPDSVHFGVNAVSDPRTNTVAVTAPDDAMKIVEQIIHEVESEPSTAFELESFTLKNADATATAKLLTTVFQPPDASGAGASAATASKGNGKDLAVKTKVIAAADDRTNTVIVTASADTLKVIEGMIKLLDANPVSAAEIQVFHLINADPYMAGKLLESIFQPQVLQTTGSSSTNAKPPGAVDAVRKLGWISTAADSRTNTLVVTAPPDVLKVVGGIILQLDSNPASQQTFFMYRLRNGQSANLQIVLNQLFGNTQLGGTTAGTTGSTQNGQRTGTQSTGAMGSQASSAGSSSFGLGSSTSGGTGIGARRGTVTGPTGTGTSASSATSQLSAGSNRVLSELSGQAFVVADPDTNSLLVTTATRYEKEVRQIITELDRPVPQVLIKVLVAEVTHDNSADWGTDFSVLNRRPNGNGSSVAQALGNAAAQAANGGLIVSVVENNVNVVLHALATEGKLDVLSRPYILASDNQLASITVGQEVPFITNTQITDAGQQINTIQYQDVGIILNVTPHINAEGLVILDVAPEISQLTGSTVPISNGVAAPIIDKRSAQSRVGIKNGQTIVIGGLMQDQKTSTVTKVPILGDIPFIGELFRRTQTDKTKTELLIFLTPHVAQQPDSLDPMTKDELNGTNLTPNAVSPGMFREHMDGMQRGHIPETRPTTQVTNPIIEFTHPTTQPTTDPGTTSTGPIRLP